MIVKIYGNYLLPSEGAAIFYLIMHKGLTTIFLFWRRGPGVLTISGNALSMSGNICAGCTTHRERQWRARRGDHRRCGEPLGFLSTASRVAIPRLLPFGRFLAHDLNLHVFPLHVSIRWLGCGEYLCEIGLGLVELPCVSVCQRQKELVHERGFAIF